MSRISFGRTVAVFVKEFQQMMRDRLTFAMAVGIPVLQLVLFGYAINTDPKRMPTVVVAHEQTPPARALIVAMQNTGYFRITHRTHSDALADELIADGEVQFAVTIPAGFARHLVRGEPAPVLLEADATDPAASANAIAALAAIVRSSLARDLPAPNPVAGESGGVEFRVHRRYNPEGLSRYNIVPGLIGTILTMTMVMLTGLAMTRERERGTMENLLATPVRPLEVMLGKILPYVLIGYLQLGVILLAAYVLFEVPMRGNPWLLMASIGLFMIANLAVGFTFSTLARNQLQAMQMTFFFFLPSLLLSGFMFPFRGMPVWAQTLGEILPLTHFLRIVRGIMLKGNGLGQVMPQVWPLVAFLLGAGIIALLRYRRTLD